MSSPHGPRPPAPGPRAASRAWLRLAALCLCVSVAFSQDARQIIEEVQRRSQAASRSSDSVLQVIDARDKITEKRWHVDRLGSWGDSRVVLRFTAPAEVKGVALLVVNHRDRASDQWMWTPSIARERRIAFQDRKTRFFGTDFTFEDLEERDVDQFHWKLAGEESLDGVRCWRIEARPKETRSSQYTSSVVWVRQDHYVSVRLDAYVKDQVLRRLIQRDLRQIQGIWTALTLEMAELPRNSRTILKSENVRYNVPMKDSDFTLQALRREQ